MLLFAPVADIQSNGGPLYHDHYDPALLYAPPAGLRLRRTAEGAPDFMLLRYSGDFTTTSGGLLHLSLAFQPPAATAVAAAQQRSRRVVPIPFLDGRLRLRLRSALPGRGTHTGDWHAVTLTGEEVGVAAVSLTAQETEPLHDLLDSGNQPLDLEMVLRFAGLVSGLPWLVTATTADLKAFLATNLGGDAVTSDQIVAAWNSLPTGTLIWQRLSQDSTAPDQSALLSEAALRSLDVLFDLMAAATFDTPAHYRLRPISSADPPKLSWDLLPFRSELHSLELRWSADELAEELADPQRRARLFPVVSQVSPFAAVQYYVVNQLLFDSHYLQRVDVTVRHPGTGGVAEFNSVSFPGAANVAQFTAIFPALTTAFTLDYRITALLSPPDGVGWPITWKRDFVRADGPVVQITPEAAGLTIMRVEVEAELFARAAAVDVQLLAPATAIGKPLAAQQLTAANSVVTFALPGHNPALAMWVRCVAQPLAAAGQPYTLQDGLVPDHELRIPAAQLDVVAPNQIALSLAPTAAAVFPFVAVALVPLSAAATDEGTLFTLTAGETRVWSLWRQSVFEPIRFRYRVSYVARDRAGQTLPLVTTDWLIGDGSTLIVDPAAVIKGGDPGVTR